MLILKDSLINWKLVFLSLSFPAAQAAPSQHEQVDEEELGNFFTSRLNRAQPELWEVLGQPGRAGNSPDSIF